MPHTNTIFLIIFIEKLCVLSREVNVHFETEGARATRPRHRITQTANTFQNMVQIFIVE